MVHSLHVLQGTLLLSLSSYSFDLGGHEDWTWPGSTFDGLALGYGFPGWELPPPLQLPPPPVVHNHIHQYPPHDHDPHDHYYGHDPHHHYHGHDPHHHYHGHGHHGPPHDFPPFGGGYGYGHGYDSSASPYRDYLCHHAKKMKHLRKWLVKMLSCSLFF